MQGSWNRDRHKLREPRSGALDDPDHGLWRLANWFEWLSCCCPWPLFVLGLVAIAAWLIIGGN